MSASVSGVLGYLRFVIPSCQFSLPLSQTKNIHIYTHTYIYILTASIDYGISIHILFLLLFVYTYSYINYSLNAYNPIFNFVHTFKDSCNSYEHVFSLISFPQLRPVKETTFINVLECVRYTKHVIV